MTSGAATTAFMGQEICGWTGQNTGKVASFVLKRAVWLVQVRNLTEEMAALEAENGRLTEVITAEQPHNEELLMHVKELQHVGHHRLPSCVCCTTTDLSLPPCFCCNTRDHYLLSYVAAAFYCI